jgi:hypothetical protein
MAAVAASTVEALLSVVRYNPRNLSVVELFPPTYTGTIAATETYVTLFAKIVPKDTNLKVEDVAHTEAIGKKSRKFRVLLEHSVHIA